MEPNPGFRPVQAGERIVTLDVLRGFALAGILLMNIECYVGPLNAGLSGVDPGLRGIDRLADALVYFFVQGKFYPLFALLFGMGFAVMAQRAEKAGRGFVGLYFRRSMILLGIGLAHALLIWSGDILVSYALLSLPLLLFVPMRAWVLTVLGIGCFLVAPALLLLTGMIDWLTQLDPAGNTEWAAEMAAVRRSAEAVLASQQRAFGSGVYLQATAQRLRDLGRSLQALFIIAPQIFGVFLIGAAFVRSGAIAQPRAFPRLFASLRWGALPAGFLVMLASFLLTPYLAVGEVSLRICTAFALSMIAGLLMCLGYVAWIVRMLEARHWRGVLTWLAPAGRMTLTHYLAQSLICTWIFYGYGLGYFERLPRAWQIPFALALFGAQALFSRFWLRRFRFGPMEWLWRSLTYLRWQPMRIN
ncbi:MAG: DUF418 domain-containing protein [Xanthomonadaceae bacterium]|jgi:uncharacterized protein|nr:DUF418 domain-containing protein [Xanthomonadaceae bacterium]